MRVGHGAAEHAAVDAVVEGRGRSATTRTIPRRVVVSAGSPTAQLAESASTIASARSFSPCRSRIVAQAVGADLLLALDEDRDADRQLAAVRAQGRDVGHDPGLVVGGAAAVEPAVALGRLERRAVPVRRRRRAAARRGGRRAGPSARPAGPSTCPMTAGRPPSRTISTSRPSARSSSATAAALASTWAWSNASSDTLGMRTSVSRSARMSGIRARTRCLQGGDRSGVRTSSVTPASVLTASAGRRPCGGRRAGARDRAIPTIGAARHTVWIVLGRKKAAEHRRDRAGPRRAGGGQEPAHAPAAASRRPRASVPSCRPTARRPRSPDREANRRGPAQAARRP